MLSFSRVAMVIVQLHSNRDPNQDTANISAATRLLLEKKIRDLKIRNEEVAPDLRQLLPSPG